ncbi:VOC family protein [Rothia mucilaginosa]|uniref:VOC family protein n=1 Tax=Rothia mucilaginosa TaxID=43675 RepID=UPI0034C5D306
MAADAYQPCRRPATLRRAFFHVWRHESRQCRGSHQPLDFSFDDAHRGTLYHYPEGSPFEADAVMFTDFNLQGTWMAAADSGAFHDFTFTPGVSVVLSCRTQEEIDYYWEQLSAIPEAERCGWCVDRWGISWQVVPHNIAELMTDKAAREKILLMGKIDLSQL